eukprot:TRINITY_DN16438_c0_g1_i1.p1 TRINITY_DN16438_c0_g1~~TRINITY_DN16438_c0_g1_i1.p1  ORF type:complete len:408 (-),score=31.07 TRINITY_DN16438_c0_g1_i1:53-1276(-)
MPRLCRMPRLWRAGVLHHATEEPPIGKSKKGVRLRVKASVPSHDDYTRHLRACTKKPVRGKAVLRAGNKSTKRWRITGKASVPSRSGYMNHVSTDPANCARQAAVLRGGKPDKFLRWLGNKFNVRNTIASYVPTEVSTVVSPFFGSGCVEFALLRERSHIKVVASDLGSPLVCFWKQVLKSARDVADKVDELLPVRRPLSQQEYMRWNEGLAQDSASLLSAPPLLTAARFYLVNQVSYNANMMQARHCPNLSKALHKCREKRLRHLKSFSPIGCDRIQLEECDAFEAIESCPAEALLFIDPPYLSSKSTKRNEKLKRGGISCAHYACGPNWGLEAHRRLRAALDGVERWLVCHEDNPEIRELYRGFQVVEYSQNTSLYGASGGQSGSRKRQELLILSPWVGTRTGNL